MLTALDLETYKHCDRKRKTVPAYEPILPASQYISKVSKPIGLTLTSHQKQTNLPLIENPFFYISATARSVLHSFLLFDQSHPVDRVWLRLLLRF